ncbi:hypothetical protein EDD37DRAFT_474016 [Exophiala viscosa]|uniref:uncharacterized protein n=1 Tax=Exophiala viscosa TaxID=2486360 RepID=UPI00219642A0|nr:hypothetical protein EDD37DRAFT_474016 [Exophiala viscosa]
MAMSASYMSSPSPDTPSTVFPERLIRPLPRRTIKSRLSLEAAESITYPPQLPSTSLPTYSHYGEDGEYSNDGKVLVHHHDEHDHDCDYDHDHDHDSDHHDHDCPHHHHHCCHHDDYEDDLDDLESMVPASHYLASSPPRSGRHPRYSKGSVSGPDGYEAFENTNNKKKRKIPTSGSLSLHHSSMTSDFAHMGINNDGSADDSHYHMKHGGSSPGHGIQGAGRGRNARKVSGRNPLGVSVNGSNARSKYDQNLSANAKAEDSRDQGIISAAIANATALLRKPLGKGQENMGVLDQQAKQAHTNSQFTFTCETEAKGVTFPEQSLYSPGYSQRNNLGPQSQAAAGQKVPAQGIQSGPANTQQVPAAQPNAANTNGKKPRRRKGDVYVLAARQRRLQQEYNNLQHPPAPEDVWICEFCEYESIFGEPPHALIRQYEIKDRKERRRLAEKRRLLEKAKLKGRKGHRKLKKSSTHQPTPPPEEPLPDFGDDHLDSLVDDELDDEYENDPVSPTPVPAPVATNRPAGGTGANATTDKAGGTGGGGGLR